MFFASSEDITSPGSMGKITNFDRTNFTEKKENPDLMNLTRSDVKSLRIGNRRSVKLPRSPVKVDRKGKYMREIKKQSACFEHFFSLTE